MALNARGRLNPNGFPRPGAAAGFNVLFISFDTTRVDRLAPYGYKQAHTPTIDALCRQGVCIEQVSVTMPLTLGSHASMFTGLYPFHHEIRTNIGYKLAPERVTLAEKLRDAGYATAAFVSSFVLDRRFGLDQGFDAYEFLPGERGQAGPHSIQGRRDARMVTDSAEKWLAEHLANRPNQPFFEWVHYYDPHAPYVPPRDADPMWPTDPYDQQIAFADDQVGRLLRLLDDRGVRDRTLVVFVTDHGESLGEHGEKSHGIFIYDAVIRGGLIFSSPLLWKEPTRTSDRLACTIDIMPTVLSLLGLPRSPEQDGLDLVHTPIPEDRAVLIESRYPQESHGCAPLYGLRRTWDKFILAPKSEYYDLRADPREVQNLYAQAPHEGVKLATQLNEMMTDHAEIQGDASRRTRLSDSEIQKLRSLGYLGGDVEVESDKTQLPDPKDRIALFSREKQAQELVKSGRVEEGLRLALELMNQLEGDEAPLHTAAQIYEGLGRFDEANRLLEAFAAKYPSANVFVHLAQNQLKLEQWPEFEKALNAAAALDPNRGSIHLLRGDQLMQLGRFTEAVAAYEMAFEIDAVRMGKKEREKLENARAAASATRN